MPSHLILSVTNAIGGEYGTEHTDEALYRSAFVPVLSLVLVGPQLGLAKGALTDVTASLAKGKGISYTFYEKATDSGSTQINVAEAASLIDTAELHRPVHGPAQPRPRADGRRNCRAAGA